MEIDCCQCSPSNISCEQCNRLNVIFSHKDVYNYFLADPLPSNNIPVQVQTQGFACICQDYYNLNPPISNASAFITIFPDAREVMFFNDPNAWYKISYNIRGLTRCREFIRVISVNREFKAAHPTIDINGRQVVLSQQQGEFIVLGILNNIVIQNPSRSLQLSLSVLHIQPEWPISPWISGQNYCIDSIPVYSTRTIDEGKTQRIVDPHFQNLSDCMRMKYLVQSYSSCDSCTRPPSNNRIINNMLNASGPGDVAEYEAHSISTLTSSTDACNTSYNVLFNKNPNVNENNLMTSQDYSGNASLHFKFSGDTVAHYVQFRCSITLQYDQNVGNVVCTDAGGTYIKCIGSSSGTPFLVFDSDLQPTGGTSVNNQIITQGNTVIWNITDIIIMSPDVTFGFIITTPAFRSSTSPDILLPIRLLRGIITFTDNGVVP